MSQRSGAHLPPDTRPTTDHLKDSLTHLAIATDSLAVSPALSGTPSSPHYELLSNYPATTGGQAPAAATCSSFNNMKYR